MNIAALIISILAAIFAGMVAFSSFREQRLRLRAQVYIDKIETSVTKESLSFRMAIGNVGLLPAKKVKISPILKVNDVRKKLSADDFQSKAIILPNQTFWNRMSVVGNTMQHILQGKTLLSADITIECESNGKDYYYKENCEFNRTQLNWTVVDGDAN